VRSSGRRVFLVIAQHRSVLRHVFNHHQVAGMPIDLWEEHPLTIRRNRHCADPLPGGSPNLRATIDCRESTVSKSSSSNTVTRASSSLNAGDSVSPPKSFIVCFQRAEPASTNVHWPILSVGYLSRTYQKNLADKYGFDLRRGIAPTCATDRKRSNTP
jgi:hypothetical protein